MTLNQLTAVPPVPPATFRERAMAAQETHQGQDLIALLARMHEEVMGEVVEQAVSARTSVMQMADAAVVDQRMLANVLETLRPVLRLSAENAARAGHWSGMVESVRAVLRDAENSGVSPDPEALKRIITTVGAAPAFRPQSYGFVPSTQYRVGHFRHVQTGVTYNLPFCGFTSVMEAADRPMTVHVSFLHNAVVRARPQLYAEYGLAMEHME